MQAQATRTSAQSITAAQSLAAVQTMLMAGLGCITYLRDLLPEENFTQSQLVADEESSISYRRSDTSFSSVGSIQGRGSNGFRITVETMTRGYSDEGDKILNYLENGIFDALQKEYLRSFIFAIYLDPNDPNNIIEAYTFNFKYHTFAETGITIPIMTLGDDLQQLSLKNNARDNPVAEAAKKGKAPTLLDVKKSVKAILKTLIHATTQMDVLPKRRFATFKLFYTDKTPANYEPPHFQSGDQEKDKWYFMTHDLDEIPDRWSIGRVNTGHHSVKLSVTSIATYLPSSSLHNNSGGMSLRTPGAPNLTPAEEASLRTAQAEQQIVDAQTRYVAWSGDEAVELEDADVEGDNDLEYVPLPDGSYKRIISDEPNALIPSGIRNNETGVIEPLRGPVEVEAHFAGVTEKVHTDLKDLNLEKENERSAIEETQVLGSLRTQDVPMTSPNPVNPVNRSSTSSATESPIFFSSREKIWSLSTTSPISRRASDTDMDMLKGMHTPIEEPTPLDIETQVESIESFHEHSEATPDQETVIPRRAPSMVTKQSTLDDSLQCECGISIEDPSCLCEGNCGRWFHVWCMGYHSADDPRMPSKFYCFSCRLQADRSWPLIKAGLYSTMLSKFQELSLFRRVIKVAETLKGPWLVSDLTKANGTTRDVSRRLIRRLEREDFISEQTTTLDDLGFPQTVHANQKGKSKAKHAKARKNVQLKKYIFHREATLSSKYADYFNPDPTVEGRLLKIQEMTFKLKSDKGQGADPSNAAATHSEQMLLEEPRNETQTQEDSQTLFNVAGLKRSHPVDDDGNGRPKKKVKISVTYGLDLAE